MMKLPLLIFASSLCAVSVSAQSADIPAGYTVDNLARDIISKSPATDLLFVEAEAVAADKATLGNLPDPELEGEYLVGPENSANRWNAGISWSLDWPGSYRARSRQGEAESDLARKEAMAEAFNQLSEVKSLLVEVVAANRTLTLLNDMMTDSDSILNYARRANLGGETSLLDLQKIRIETARTRARIIDTENARSAVIEDLNARFGTDLTAAALSNLTYTVTPLLQREEYLERTISSPIAESAVARIRAAESAISTTKAERLPSLGIGYTHAYEEGTHFNGASLSLSLPIFSSRGKMKSAELAHFAATSSARVTIDALKRETTQLYDRAVSLRTQLDEIGPIFETTDLLSMMHKAYAGGEWSLVDYLTERRYLIEANLEYLDLQRQYQTTLTLLNRF